jgi:hypothetical protein
MRFEPGTSRIRSRSVNNSTKIFGYKSYRNSKDDSIAFSSVDEKVGKGTDPARMLKPFRLGRCVHKEAQSAVILPSSTCLEF